MKRINATLSRILCLLLCVGCGVLSCRSQILPPSDIKTLENPGGGKVIYGPLAAPSAPSEGMVYMLRMVHSHFGDRPVVESLVKSRDGNSTAAFFSVTAQNDGDKPITGLIVVATAANASPQSAVLFDDADRFASTEAQLLHLLASADAPSSENGIGPMHLASGGDKSAAICLADDWTISQVSNGSLTAKGPHNEIIALGFAQMVLDPSNAEAQRLAHMASFSKLPQAKFPDDTNLLTTFIDVLNQLRTAGKLPPASFTNISSRKLDARGAKVRPLEATFDLDLADDVGPRKGSARIDVYRSGHSAEWLMSVNSSSIPVAYAASENRKVLAMIQSFRQNAPLVTGIEVRGGPGGDPMHLPFNDGGFMHGERPDPKNCAEISGPAPAPIGWPGKIAESFILDPAARESSADGSRTDAPGKLAEWLVKSHPDLFEVGQVNDPVHEQDY